MRTIVAGGGPIGIYTAIALARRGHEVTLVDRDPGPPATGAWRRRGVMQADHPHGWRPAVRRALLAEMPDVLTALVAAGAVPHVPPAVPPGLEDHMTGLFCRRTVVERVLRRAAHAESGLTWRTGHVDKLLVEDDAASGVVVDGRPLLADMVVVATGRASHLDDDLRGPAEGGGSGFAYLFRHYRARRPEDACRLPLPSYSTGPGYVSLVMPQDAGTHAALISYPVDAPEVRGLRTSAGFDRAATAIPNLAPWTDARFEPLTDVVVGGNLTNTYRLQGPALGMPPARGLCFVGDAVLTTNPAAGRNVSLLLAHVQHLLLSLDAGMRPDDVSLALDAFAEEHIRPWWTDHVHLDRTLLRRFAGRELDLRDRIPSDVICAAAEADPAMAPYAGMYLGMVAGPDVLDPVEDTARSMLAAGWRPEVAGPTRSELAAAVLA